MTENNLTLEIAHTAARLIAEEGLDYATAKNRACEQLYLDNLPRGQLPNNQLIEDTLRDYLKLYYADSHPTLLKNIRQQALVWMQRLNEFNPHLIGAVWNGTATTFSPIRIELFHDNPKDIAIKLINQHIDYEPHQIDHTNHREPIEVLKIAIETTDLLIYILPESGLRQSRKRDANNQLLKANIDALKEILCSSST
jgi:hypothetical protein